MNCFPIASQMHRAHCSGELKEMVLGWMGTWYQVLKAALWYMHAKFHGVASRKRPWAAVLWNTKAYFIKARTPKHSFFLVQLNPRIKYRITKGLILDFVVVTVLHFFTPKVVSWSQAGSVPSFGLISGRKPSGKGLGAVCVCDWSRGITACFEFCVLR